MKQVTLSAVILLMSFSSFARAAAPQEQLAQLEQRVAKAATSVAGEYAKPLLDAARASISEARIYFAAGKEKSAGQQMEMAAIQLNAADAKGAEKELLEKVAIRRSELKKMEARLERFRQGEEN